MSPRVFHVQRLLLEPTCTTTLGNQKRARGLWSGVLPFVVGFELFLVGLRLPFEGFGFRSLLRFPHGVARIEFRFVTRLNDDGKGGTIAGKRSRNCTLSRLKR